MVDVQNGIPTAPAYLDCQRGCERAWEGEQDGCVSVRHDLRPWWSDTEFLYQNVHSAYLISFIIRYYISQ